MMRHVFLPFLFLLTLHVAVAQDTSAVADEEHPGIAFSIGSWQSRTSLNTLNGFIPGGRDFPTPRMLYGGGMQIYGSRSVWDLEMVFSKVYRRRPTSYEQLALTESRIVFGWMYAIAGNDRFRLQTGLSMGLGNFLMSYFNDSFMAPGVIPGVGNGTFRNRSDAEDYSNDAFLLIPRVQLMLIPAKYMAVSIGAGYQFDMGSSLWTFQDNLKLFQGPVTEQDGLSIQLGLHFGFGFERTVAGTRF